MREARLDPQREIDALAALKAAYARECEADPDFVVDLAEGETSLLEAIDALAEADLVDEAMIAGVDGAAAALKARKERFAGRREARRVMIEQALMILDVKKLERPTATLSLANRPVQVVVDDESAIPSRFFVVGDPKLDKRALKSALEAGEEAPGAHLSNGSVSLTIRRR